MDFTTSLIVGLVTGTVGIAYFVYGKRQQRFVPLLAGIALCAYPYFVDNLIAALVIGAVLLVLPWVLRIED
jgi:multisubunit Na+/H+ antiporter MnhC subunit